MPSSLKHPCRWPVFLLLATLSLQVGARMNLCLMPDGDVHVQQHQTPCHAAESQTTIDFLASGDHHLDRQAHLDIAIEEGASTSQQQNLKHSSPAIIPLGEPITSAPIDQRLARNTQLDISPQLLPLRAIVVLRI